MPIKGLGMHCRVKILKIKFCDWYVQVYMYLCRVCFITFVGKVFVNFGYIHVSGLPLWGVYFEAFLWYL